MKVVWVVLLVAAMGVPATARTVVYWQDGFPVVESQPVSRPALEKALAGDEVTFKDSAGLSKAGALDGADLLVMPYGSAFPEPAWGAILGYLRHGGNLLVLGGRPFHAPDGGNPADAYERALGIVHSYEAPGVNGALRFAWRDGYGFLPTVNVRAKRVFALEGRLDGLGYLLDGDGDKRAAPVVVVDHAGRRAGAMQGGRWVLLDFEPEAGYWDSAAGGELIATAAGYARQGAAIFSVELEFSTLRPGEKAGAVVHYRNAAKYRRGEAQTGTIQVELMSKGQTIATRTVECAGLTVERSVMFDNSLEPGFYRIRATYSDSGRAREYYGNGFWVAERAAVEEGPALGVNGDFLARDGKPFFPFGTNYFSTEENGWDFSGPRNAAVWEDDFAAMERHGVSFVRTGVWGGHARFVSALDGGVSERFLRNLEAYLLCARRHHIAVNFTFFAFMPNLAARFGPSAPGAAASENPYLSPAATGAERDYILSIVSRFKNVPYLCWDLINEPSFSNPMHLWRGNTPNGDADERAAWHKWLKSEYGSVDALAAAWSATAGSLRSFDDAPLPNETDLSAEMEHGQTGQSRASDYNHFAQDMFAGWVRGMVQTVRAAGSKQLIDVGQDEGGVTNRLLNQFYAGAGLAFTTNHTYRQNDALVWDSLAAKAPGVANIVGETGYQPVILPNGRWQYDEESGLHLIERKWAAGFAGGTSGAMSWDWDREIHFGIERSDGSEKLWEDMTRAMGAFAARAAPQATRWIQPETAIVLPQSLQLSTLGRLSIEAQQACVRALYGYARGEAYAVGEDQIERLGAPKLILLPSPWVLSEKAWDAILDRVRVGATLLVTGRFDLGAHFEPTDRAAKLGIDYKAGRLLLREVEIEWPGGKASLTYSGSKTDYLDRAFFDGGKTFLEKPLGEGRIFFVPFPVELSDDARAAGELYRYAMAQAMVKPAYTTAMQDPDVLICPTRFPHATLYVIMSESAAGEASFRDEASGKAMTVRVAPGGAALRLISETGDVLAEYP